MLSLGFMHAGNSNRKSWWKWFLINSSVLILTWNFILDYLLLSDYAHWGCFWVPLSCQLGHTFGLPLCRDQDMGFFPVSLTQRFSADVTHWCQRWLEIAVTDTGQLKVSSQTSHNCHPCTDILKAMPHIGATAGNCSFFLISFSALSQVPQGCGYSKSSGRPRVAYAWNVRILEKIFPNVSRGESREEMKTAAKWSLIKRHVSSRPKPTLKFLTEGAVTKKGACQSGICVACWEAVFWRHNTNHSAQGSII